MEAETHSVATANGRSIQATFYVPSGTVHAAVLIVNAMGVSQKFYAPLASWLADRGYLTATFDYAGIGQSRVPDLAKLDVDILDWARFDCDAMLVELQRRAPDKPLYWVGHSLGGQLLGLLPDSGRIAKAVTIATGSGYWRENSPQLRWRVWWMWYVAAPLATRIFGYFPGKRLRKVGDLPPRVIQQWRRWCLNPHYAVGAEGAHVKQSFESVRVPITAISFTDDEMMSARNTDSLHGFYTGAAKKMVRIAPEQAGLERIGHFGFFQNHVGPKLWESYLLPELATDVA